MENAKSKILGIDPGPSQSAYVVWDTKTQQIVDHEQSDNITFRKNIIWLRDDIEPDICVIEGMAFYGKVMNGESFDTLMFIGRLREIFADNHELVYFPDIAYHFCNSRRGIKSSHINAVLANRFGGKGTKKNKGKLFGIKEHVWSALACCILWEDLHAK